MKRNFRIYFVTLLGMLFSINGNSQVWDWAFNIPGSSSNSYSQRLKVDSLGNIYVAGFHYDSPIQKYDSLKNQIWAKTGNERGTDLAIDEDLNVYVACSNFIVTKYDKIGNQIWNRNFNGTSDEYFRGISVDSLHNVYLAGFMLKDSVNFGGITVHNHGANQTADIIIAKLNSDGNLMWVKNIGGANIDKAYSLITNKSGDIFITGYFEGSVDFGGIVLTNNGLGDVFFIRIDSDGNLLWAKNMGGDDLDFVNKIIIDDQQNYFITGYFKGSYFAFDSTTISGGSGRIGYFAKFDENGNLLFAKRMYLSDCFANDISISSNKNIYITGFYYNSGKWTAYINKYDSNGNFIWSKTPTVNSLVESYGISIDNYNNLYITGRMWASAAFGSTIISQDCAYIAKLKNDEIVSVPELNNSITIIYPNPAQDEFFIEILNIEQQTTNIEVFKIYGIDGKKLLEGKLDSSKTRISTKELESGVYFVEVNVGGEKVNGKLVITK